MISAILAFTFLLFIVDSRFKYNSITPESGANLSVPLYALTWKNGLFYQTIAADSRSASISIYNVSHKPPIRIGGCSWQSQSLQLYWKIQKVNNFIFAANANHQSDQFYRVFEKTGSTCSFVAISKILASQSDLIIQNQMGLLLFCQNSNQLSSVPLSNVFAQPTERLNIWSGVCFSRAKKQNSQIMVFLDYQYIIISNLEIWEMQRLLHQEITIYYSKGIFMKNDALLLAFPQSGDYVSIFQVDGPHYEQKRQISIPSRNQAELFTDDSGKNAIIFSKQLKIFTVLELQNYTVTNISLDISGQIWTVNVYNSIISITTFSKLTYIFEINYIQDSNQSIVPNCSDKCISCGQNCETCLNFSICISCSEGFDLDWTGSCVQQNIGSIIAYQINKIPGSHRIIRPLFFYLFAFDDLQLYQYHEREYGEGFTLFLNIISKYEKEKWEIYDKSAFIQLIRLNQSEINNILDYRGVFFQSNFTKTQGFGETILINILGLIAINLPIQILLFIILWCIFQFLFRYPISRMFRSYCFIAYFIIIFFEGNLQYISFLIPSQLKNIYFWQFYHKIIVSVSKLFIFFCITYGIGGSFLFYGYYKKLIFYLTENIFVSLKGIAFFSIHICIRNVILGFTHNLLRSHSLIQISTLLAIQVMYICVLIGVVRFRRCFYIKFRVWLMISFSFLRLLLQLTFFLDSEGLHEFVMSLQNHFIILMCIIFVGGTISQICIFIKMMLKRFVALWKIKTQTIKLVQPQKVVIYVKKQDYRKARFRVQVQQVTVIDILDWHQTSEERSSIKGRVRDYRKMYQKKIVENSKSKSIIAEDPQEQNVA